MNAADKRKFGQHSPIIDNRMAQLMPGPGAVQEFALKKWLSFRRRLAAAAACNMLLAIAMTAILLITARNAADVVEAARASQLRTSTFSALQFAADRYQRAMYDVLRRPSAETRAALPSAAAAFEHARHRVDLLRSRTASERAANLRVAALSANLSQMIAHLPTIVADVDASWRAGGTTAAMRAIQAQSEPYFTLIDTLQRQIELNDSALRQSTEQANTLQRAVVPIATVALLLALITTVIVFVLIIGRLSPSLRRLEQGVRAFAQGEHSHHIDVGGYDEFTRLGDSFNEMATQIGEQQGRLRASATYLEQAVAERTADLAQANEMLEEADQRRRVFFAEVSHELRTPITIIHGEAQVALRHSDLGIGDPAESFARILGQSREMRRLINDLFLIARAEADGLELHLAPVDVGALIESVAEDFQAIAGDSGVAIIAKAAAQLMVDGDAGRLRQIFAAAVDNAMRHGGAGIMVELEARRRAGAIEIFVRDDGPGVNPAILQSLLQRFRRGETTAEGSGLGLTIIRALTEAHGGKVSLANRPKGGLILQIVLPAGKEAPREERERDVGIAASGGCDEGREVRATGARS